MGKKKFIATMLGLMCIYGISTNAWAGEIEDWIFEGQLNADNTYIFSDGSEYVDVKKYTGWTIEAENKQEAIDKILKKIRENTIIDENAEPDEVLDWMAEYNYECGASSEEYEQGFYMEQIIMNIADKEHITVSKDEICDMSEKKAKEWSPELEVDDFLVEFGETIPIEILKDKVTDFLLENNKVMIKESSEID